MDSTETSVLERRVQELERMLGTDNSSAHVQLPIPDLRKADRALSHAVPHELVHAAATLRACRAGGIARSTGIQRADAIVTEAIEGLKEMQTLAPHAGVDVSHILDAEQHMAGLQRTARSVAGAMNKVDRDVDVLLARYNAAVARANAAVLGVANAVRKLEGDPAL